MDGHAELSNERLRLFGRGEHPSRPCARRVDQHHVERISAASLEDGLDVGVQRGEPPELRGRTPCHAGSLWGRVKAFQREGGGLAEWALESLAGGANLQVELAA